MHKKTQEMVPSPVYGYGRTKRYPTAAHCQTHKGKKMEMRRTAPLGATAPHKFASEGDSSREKYICVCTPATKFAGACVRKPSHGIPVNAGYRENRNGPVRSRCRRPQRKRNVPRRKSVVISNRSNRQPKKTRHKETKGQLH